MHEGIEARLRQLAQRAGLGGVPPAVVAAAGVLFVLAVAWGAWRWWPTQAAGAGSGADSGSGGVLEVTAKPKASSGESGGASETVRGATAGATGTVFVHVVGAVHHPGLYELAAGSRVADAVSAAGGLAAGGAQEGVNLASLVKDGEQVAIPTREELKRGGASAGGGAVGSAAGAAGSGASRQSGAGGAAVNINTADAAALDTLPGIGPSTAAKIVADREANGPFATPDDLGRVPGIGPKKLEQLKPAICVN